MSWIDTLESTQRGRQFADGIFNSISLNEKNWNLHKIYWKSVPCGIISNMAALVQLIAWRRTGDKPLSEAILEYSTEALTWPQWLKCCLTHSGRDKCIFLNQNVCFPIKISLKFVSKGQINKIPALVQIMAWRRPGYKPLSEPMMVSLPTHIYVIRL